MAFNEDSRVKIPALIHLTRLGYTYLPQRQLHTDHLVDSQTNIITDIFVEQLKSLNPGAKPEQLEMEIKNIQDALDFEDLGRSFYKRLLGIGEGSLKLIDWANFSKNKF